MLALILLHLSWMAAKTLDDRTDGIEPCWLRPARDKFPNAWCKLSGVRSRADLAAALWLIDQAPGIRAPATLREQLGLNAPTSASAPLRPPDMVTSVQPATPTRGPPSICYVHVNKAGGASVSSGLMKLLGRGLLSGYTEVHGCYNRSVGRKERQPMVYVDNQNHKANQAARRFLLGPIHLATCPPPRKLVLWVRDPVARMVSCWSFFMLSEEGGGGEVIARQRMVRAIHRKTGLNASLGLGAIIDEMSRRSGSEGVTRLIASMGHARSSLAAYVLGADATMRALASNLLYVGTTENFGADWAELMKRLGVPARDAAPVEHKHRTPRDGSPLTARGTRDARSALAASYGVIWWLVGARMLPRSYYDAITRDPDG